ncbi:MAG: radical SAM protein [Desulfurococcales archaeon]|nr:radical SAM protein [Desulfurococcales archaeon]
MAKPIAFIPSNYYVSLSVSGTYCELMCPYCRGRYLTGMEDVSNPENLRKVMNLYYARGARGFLISGGFTRGGYLIISEAHLRVLREFKVSHDDVVISVHSGLMPKELLDKIWSAGIDFIDFEVPPSNDYLRKMKNLPRHSVSDYIEFIDYVTRYDRNFIVPHVVLHSRESTLSDELGVISELGKFKLRLLVALIEISDSSRLSASHTFDIERVMMALRRSRRLFSEVALGCMRPLIFKARYDELIIRENLADRIVNPRRNLILKYGLPVIYACCSIEKHHFKLFPSENYPG